MAFGLDYPDWTAPQAHADAIAVTGTPLLSNPALLVNTTFTLGAGAGNVLGPFAVAQPSYEIEITASQAAAGAAGPVQVLMSWTDVGSGATIATEERWIWPGVAAGHVIEGRGPTKGGQVSVAFTNTSVAESYNIVVSMFDRTHIYLNDDWRTRAYTTTIAPGGVLPVIDVPASLLAFRSTSVAAAGSDTTELPLYTGLVQLFADTSSATSDMVVTVQDSANPNAEGIGTRFYRLSSDGTGKIAAAFYLPRYQCRVSMTNNNAAAKTLSYMLHAID